jgi:hypothetical protein
MENEEEGRKSDLLTLKELWRAEQKKMKKVNAIDQILNATSENSSWIFLFMDIIYVATIYNISSISNKCGEETDVYVMIASYFAIMFSTRMFFTTYTAMYNATGVLHILAFVLYGMGVFIMTLNIATKVNVQLSEHGELEYLKADYGFCNFNSRIDQRFAIGFLCTRIILVVDFWTYNYSGLKDRHATMEEAAEVTGRFRRVSGASSQGGRSVSRSSSLAESTRSISMNSEAGISGFKPSLMHPDGGSSIADTSNSSSSAAGAGSRLGSAADAEHAAHTRSIFLWRIIPLVLSSITMCFIFLTHVTPLQVFPVVAVMEFVSDVLPQVVLGVWRYWNEVHGCTVTAAAQLKQTVLLMGVLGSEEKAHHLIEQIGLMFLLVLGECMLGLLQQVYNSAVPTSTYYTLM